MSMQKVVMIEIESIRVVSPRTRNKFKHDEIKESIKSSGLRRPITVRRIRDDKFAYALICGQGRLEAVSLIGDKLIPAIILDVDSDKAYIMSLVENIARRKPRANELYERIREMYLGGLDEATIAGYVGCSEGWVRSVMLLLNQGEQRLLSIVESGAIPVYIAVEFAKMTGEESQNLLIEAYEKGVIKPTNVTKIREILDLRGTGTRSGPYLAYAKKKPAVKLTAEDLMNMYQESVNEHKKILTKYQYVDENLMVCRKIMSELLVNDDFLKILDHEGLDHIPNAILDRYSLEGDGNDSEVLQ